MPRRISLAAALFAALAACASARPPPAAVAPPPPAGHVLALQALASARAAAAAGDRAAQRRELSRAVEADPGWDLPRLDLAELLLRDGGEATAALALLDAPGMRPGNPRLPRLRAVALEQAGDPAGAIRAYADALALSDDPDLGLRRATLLAEAGRRDEALDELERVRTAHPREPLVHSRLAELYEAAGRRAEAAAELRWLAAAAPRDPTPQLRLARFYRRGGDVDRAALAEEAARALDPPPRVLRPLRRP